MHTCALSPAAPSRPRTSRRRTCMSYYMYRRGNLRDRPEQVGNQVDADGRQRKDNQLSCNHGVWLNATNAHRLLRAASDPQDMGGGFAACVRLVVYNSANAWNHSNHAHAARYLQVTCTKSCLPRHGFALALTSTLLRDCPIPYCALTDSTGFLAVS